MKQNHNRALRLGLGLLLCTALIGTPTDSQGEGAFEARILELLEPVPQQTSTDREATAQALAELGVSAALGIGHIARTVDEVRRDVAVAALQQMGPALADELCAILADAKRRAQHADAAYIVGSLAEADTSGLEPAFPLLIDIVARYDAGQRQSISALHTLICKSEPLYLEVTRRFVGGGENFWDVLRYTRCAPPEALRLLVDTLESREDYFHSGARELLEYHGENAMAVYPYLASKLQLEPYPGQLDVPDLMVKIGGVQAIPPLMSVLTGSGGEALRAAAANALVPLKDEAVPALVSALAVDRFHAARALAAMGESAETTLLQAANDPDALVRTGALYALGCMELLSPVCRAALEQALTREETVDQCIAALALAKHPATESTLHALKAALDGAPSASAESRVLTDCYFQLTLPAETVQSEALPPHEVGKRDIPTEVDGEIVEEYWLRLEEQDPPIPLSTVIGYRGDNWREGFDPGSLQLRIVQPGRLLEATWSTLLQGNGKYQAGSILLLYRDENGWREVFRHNGRGASGGMGSGGADYHTYRFNYSPALDQLRYQHLVSEWYLASAPGAFCSWTGWGGGYRCDHATTTTWECAFEDATLTFKPGVQWVVADVDFSRTDWSNGPEEALVALNPHMQGRHFWTGMVYTATDVPVPVPDHTVYIRYPGTP